MLRAELAETEARSSQRNSCSRIDVCLTTCPLTWVSVAVCDFHSKADSCAILALSLSVLSISSGVCLISQHCVCVCVRVLCFSCCAHLLCVFFRLLDFWGSFGCLVSRFLGFSVIRHLVSAVSLSLRCPLCRRRNMLSN